jgi:hypothetical protein
MATLKQKKLAKAIVENLEGKETKTAGEMLEKVGYSQHLVKQPGRVIESEGVQEALEEYGFTEENAKKVVSEIMLNGDVDPNARLKATDQVFKVNKSYGDGGGNTTNNVIFMPLEIIEKYKLDNGTPPSTEGNS